MRVARCIKVEQRSNYKYYTLKFPNGSIQTVGESYIYDNMLRTIDVINLYIDTNRNIQVVKRLDSFQKFRVFYDKQMINEDSHKAFLKSQLIGACPVDNTGVVPSGTYDSVVLTDESNVLTGTIKANQITFIGSRPLSYKMGFSNSYRDYSYSMYIRCKEAIIMNPCVMPNLQTGMSIRGIKIICDNVLIKHNFIDVYTAYELYHLITHEYTHDSDTKTLLNVRVDFKKCGIDYMDIKNISKELTYKIINEYNYGNYDYRKLLATLHWNLALYKSTECSVDYILKMADMCNNELLNNKNIDKSSLPRLAEVQELYAKLKGVNS